VLAIVAGIWMLLHRTGVATVSGDAVDVFGSTFVALARRVAPSVPLYVGAAALLISALGSGGGRSETRHCDRPSPTHQCSTSPTASVAEMGRRQASAVAAPAPFLSAGVQPLHRTVLRQRRGVLRSPCRGRLRDREVVLIDSNADLIGCYEVVRAQPDEVGRELERLAAAHAHGGEAQYYAVRDEQFNPIRDRLRRGDGRIAYTPALAAMLIYLNRTGFNGLFRLNARGAFNVPAGRYERPNIADRDKLARVAEALSGTRLRLVWGSFEVGAGCGRGRRLRLFRSALRAAQPHRQLHVVHGAALRRRGSAAAAGDGDRARRARLLRPAQQLDGRRDRGALRARRRRARRRAARDPRAGAARHQQQRRAARPVDEFLITNYAPASQTS
jgi:hypothetical protein